MRDVLAIIAGLFGKRFTTKQKTRFIDYTGKWAKKRRINIIIDSEKKETCRNVYLGDVQQAHVILSAPYDTPSRVFWLGLRYYPYDSKKALRTENINMALNILFSLLMITAYYVFVLRPGISLNGTYMWLSIAGMAAVVFIAYGLFTGIANGGTYIRNSASVALLFEYMNQAELGNDVAVAFLDRSTTSFDGYRKLEEYLGSTAKAKHVVTLDCVAGGHSLFLRCDNALATRIEEAEIFDEKTHLLGTKSINNESNALQLFPKGVLLAGGDWENDQVSIKGTRNNSNKKMDVKRLELLLKQLTALVQFLKENV